ncbi:jerky protein homolog-like [Leptopilina boulardi]|uniref:jerky protein homolog-like n=1 Tax=Leptopilina boulardi TaxID=63433 RepID=UPI0021F54636|nr:jerky protein homolog-like [Leptopilina boulardi]
MNKKRKRNSESTIIESFKNRENKHYNRSWKHMYAPNLDNALIKWFQQRRDIHPLSRTIIREKAILFNKMLNGPPDFKASYGWLDKFKKRNGIQLFEIKGKLNNSENAKHFSMYLRDKIASENLSLENVYNADESGIYWRTLVSCILSHEKEREFCHDILEAKDIIKDRVTTLFCANATGNNQIPLLLIGKEETPECLKDLSLKTENARCFKMIKNIDVFYTNQSSAWMDKIIFKQWYKEIFIPHALEFQRKSGTKGKILLILDNAPCHPSRDELNAINKNIQVIYLHPNVTATIQPMYQLISFTKKYYKQNLLKRLLSFANSVDGVDEFLRIFNYRDCFELLNIAWNTQQFSTLQNVWKCILGDSYQTDENNISTNIEDTWKLPNEITNELFQILYGSNFTVNVLKEICLNWYKSKDDDCGWEPLSDNDILNFVINKNETINMSDEFVNSERLSNSDIKNFNIRNKKKKTKIIKENSDSDLSSSSSDVVRFNDTIEIESVIIKEEIILDSDTIFES